MAKRQQSLTNTLVDFGQNVRLPLNKSLIYKSEYNTTVQEIYKNLGGILEQYPTNFGSFDIELDSCYIELDEEQHFTPYRKITLMADFYSNYKCFPVSLYSQLCEKNEAKASKSVGFWTNNSCEKQFGKSSDNGNFLGNGSARWKQRAFYDFLKDIYGLINNKRVYRFSIYELIKDDISINEALNNNDLSGDLFNFVSNRINQND